MNEIPKELEIMVEEIERIIKNQEEPYPFKNKEEEDRILDIITYKELTQKTTNKIKVTFHKTYEIDEKDVLEALKKDYCDIENPMFSDKEIKDKAVDMVIELASKDKITIINDPVDIITYTVEILPKENK